MLFAKSATFNHSMCAACVRVCISALYEAHNEKFRKGQNKYWFYHTSTKGCDRDIACVCVSTVRVTIPIQDTHTHLMTVVVEVAAAAQKSKFIIEVQRA